MEEPAHAQSGGLRWASSQQTKLFQMLSYKSCCSGRAQQPANADCFFPLLREKKVRAALAESREPLRVQHSALQSSKPQNITKESDKSSVFGSRIFQILGYILESSTLLYLIMVFTSFSSTFASIFLPECSAGTVADVLFLVDGSWSVGRANFKYIRSFISATASAFQIGQDKTRVGVVQYGSDARVEFNLNTHLSRPALLRAIGSLPYKGGDTMTGNQHHSHNT